MTRYHGRHRKPTTTGRTVAKVAITGMVVGAPLTVLAAPASAAGNNWDAVAQCESGGNWGINTGNGFSGGLQFTPSTWSAYGGQGSAQNASKDQQIQVAERVLAGQGKGAWPVCGRGLGSANASPAQAQSAPVQQSAPKQQYTAPKQQATQYSAPKQQAPVQQQQATTKSAPAQQSSAPQSTPGGNYTVKSGDTLSNIAAANNVAGGYQAIAAANPSAITDVNLIFPGQVLKLG